MSCFRRKPGRKPPGVGAVGPVVQRQAMSQPTRTKGTRKGLMTTADRVEVAGMNMDKVLFDFLSMELLPGIGIFPATFFSGLSKIVHDLGPRNRALLRKRQDLQTSIDRWHIDRGDCQHDSAAYRAFLEDIGYLLPEGPAFSVTTSSVDDEIARVPGPQLVVPASNARYAINAANARWGSLYDALYGTDALGDAPTAGPYDGRRGARVIAWGRSFLDEVVPLASGSWSEATGFSVSEGSLSVLVAGASASRQLEDPEHFAGYAGRPETPERILLKHNGLHIEIRIDTGHPVGEADRAGISDIVLEAAVSTIVDLEDSVAAVDAKDKVTCYRNWLGLVMGELSVNVDKGDDSFVRKLAADKRFLTPDGSNLTLPGCSLLLVRNVGHLMTTSALLDRSGNEAYEGLIDGLVTVAAAVRGLASDRPNSRCGSVYVVKPKMHGPEEVAFANDLFAAIERILNLPDGTVKVGLMDEERRTSLNLQECIRAAQARIAFVNTGFLDRTGDEIHTSMAAGPMIRKGDMKAAKWIQAYEDSNVDTGIACGLPGRAQIGKGMWAAPDLMRAMLEQKLSHPRSGANCAWVPSPTAATLHATHYHRVDVVERQRELASLGKRDRREELLKIPLGDKNSWSPEDIRQELENNAQGILGYVVRWIDQGVGCSKVPDIDNVGLMEDRATCRISSQHIANWLRHGVVSDDEVRSALKRMARIVDQQNAGDPAYQPMSPGFSGLAFKAACDLVFQGAEQPSGYTEPTLHRRRTQRKQQDTQLRAEGA